MTTAARECDLISCSRLRATHLMLTRAAFLLGVAIVILILDPGWLAGQPGDATVTGRVVCRGVLECPGAVVFVEQLPGRRFEPRSEAVLDQVGLKFVPHVLTVLAGTRVSFPNSDEIRHNVFSSSPAKRFNLGLYPAGTVKSLMFDRAGVVELLCNVPAEMSAFIVVTDTPFAGSTGADGSYRLERLPAGTLVLHAWREQRVEQRREVTLLPGRTVSVDFELSGR